MITELWAAEDDRRRLMVLEQQLPDGRKFRWLCSCMPGAPLVVESVVGIRSCLKRRHRTTTSFDRDVLLPAYHRVMASALCMRCGCARHICIMGLGGGVLPLFIAQHIYPRAVMSAVEADARIARAASEFFGVHEGPRLRVHIMDVAAYFARFPSSRFDVLLLDVGHGAPCLKAPPRRLITLSALRKLRNHLRKGGILLMNFVGDANHLRYVKGSVSRAFGSRNIHAIDTCEGNQVIVATS